jgi:hypothetical protein
MIYYTSAALYIYIELKKNKRKGGKGAVSVLLRWRGSWADILKETSFR